MLFRNCHFKQGFGVPGELTRHPLAMSLTFLRFEDCNFTVPSQIGNFLSEVVGGFFRTLFNMNPRERRIPEQPTDTKEHLSRFICLKRLEVIDCGLNHIPWEIIQNPYLTHLDLSGNHLSNLDFGGSLGQLKQLRYLILSGCGLTKCPGVISGMKSIVSLDLSENPGIIAIPECYTDLRELQEFNIGNCNITSFPAVLFSLPLLQYTNLRGNRIAVLSRNVIGQLWDPRGGKEWFWDTDYLVCPPEAIWNQGLEQCLEYLGQVQEINASNRDIKELPNLSEMPRVVKVTLSGNQGMQVRKPSFNESMDINKPDELSEPEVSSAEELLENEYNDLYEISDIEINEENNNKIKDEMEKGPNQENDMDNLEYIMPSEYTTPPEPLELHRYGDCFPQLEHLDVSDCGLTQTTAENLFSYKYVATVKHLNLSGNPDIDYFPVSMRNIKELHYLDMSRCGLTMLPKFVVNLMHLRHLNLSKNKSIPVLPKWIGCSKQLRYLDLSECGLEDCSGAVFPSGLRSLDISGNKGLAKLPGTVKNLRHLLCLRLSGCGFTEYPEVVSALKQLVYLDISDNASLNVVPDSMANLSQLRHLNLSNCGLLECPSIVSNLSSLRYLRLSHNEHLSMLPQSLVKLGYLEQLDCMSCDISQVPEFLCKIERLEKVDLMSNPILAIPECCTKRPFFIPTDENLSSICVVQLDFDQLIRPPKEILFEGPMACLDFYKDDRISTMATHSFCSINVLGNHGAGKSSLVQTIINGKGALETSQEGTVVIDNHRWTVNDTIFNINDFGGNELFDIMCPIFLGRNNQLVLVAVNLAEYSLDKHNDMVTKWLAACFGHLQNGRVAVIATHSDLCEEGEIEEKCSVLRNKLDEWRDNEINGAKEEHQKSFFLASQELPIFVCSSKSGIGFNDLKLFLCSEGDLKKIRVPSAWLRIYRIILDKQYENSNSEISMTFDEMYREFIKDASYHRWIFKDSVHTIEQCMQFLHDAGAVLWFRHNKALSELIFYKRTLIINTLRAISQANLSNKMKYQDRFEEFIKSPSDLQNQLQTFTKTSKMSESLFKCMLMDLKIRRGGHQKMAELFQKLELCYIDYDSEISKNDDTDGLVLGYSIRFPWIAMKMKSATECAIGLRSVWPSQIPVKACQFSMVYAFHGQLPLGLFQKLSVRIQQHFMSNEYNRKDAENLIYIEGSGIQLLIRRNPDVSQSSIEINLRTLVKNLTTLTTLLQALDRDVQLLTTSQGNAAFDAYILCPHCLKLNVAKPKRIPFTSLNEKPSSKLKTVECDMNQEGNSEEIPAALVYPQLLNSKGAEKHIQRVINYFETKLTT